MTRMRFTTMITGLALLAATLSTSLATSAQAGTGCYIGLAAGMASTTTNATVDAVPAGGPSANLATIDGLGSQGSLVGVGGGCDLVMDNKFVLGAFGDYVWHKQSFNASAIGASINLDLTKQWTVGGRAGVFVTDSTMLYALAGWTKLSTDGIGGSITAGLPDMTGTVLGGGMEVTLSKHIKAALEYRHTSFDSQTAVLFTAPGGSITSKVQPDMNTVMVRLSYGVDFFQAAAASK